MGAKYPYSIAFQAYFLSQAALSKYGNTSFYKSLYINTLYKST